ncbi:HEPN domain-containing protein [Sulfurimonas autotrophica]|uniref:HEPN domain protein n=1 Tax=Sulfurimonas autotrophica (strain ATCC BAA-671 / DSM 16294 / JCM 11897 / OK10) TaxID=563040 RepID=E0URG5_SULAO|nr:HEPN domain-containing protein [Sulfurimonas autotrophica]ADN10051.1 HEPN domain protein [Sulfurimonas autotrophica DSM 16294]
MSSALALEWLKASYGDILVLEKIKDEELITHMTSFHAQQSIEKSLKALLEYNTQKIPKKHDVLMLKDRVEKYLQIENEDILEDSNTLYIDSRYPGDMGLLPNGKPTIKEAQEFSDFANKIFNEVCILLDVDISKMSNL